MTKQPPAAPRDLRPVLISGALVVILVFGVLGGWAFISKIDSAVIARGTVKVETNRKAVQHFEGGIVDVIHVAENQRVKRGQLLISLRPLQATASRDTQLQALHGELALEARLLAEKSRAEGIKFPDELLRHNNTPTVRKIIDDQISQFEQRHAGRKGEQRIFKKRIEQLKRQIIGHNAVLLASESRLKSFDTEWQRILQLSKEKLFPLNRLEEKRRQLAELQGSIGQTKAEIAKSTVAIGETELQLLQTELKFTQDVAEQLRSTTIRIAELREKLKVAVDVVTRLEIRAPRDGIVQAVQVHTRGGVLRPGDTVMELVPEEDTLIVEAAVSPEDVFYVHQGRRAEVRFTGYRGRNAPMILGTIQSLSADVIEDANENDGPFFRAKVRVEGAQLPPELSGKLSAGMPAEVVLSTGERTVAEYLLGPLMNSLRTTMREPS